MMESEGTSSTASASQTREADDNSPELAMSEFQKKRNRIRFSCTTCRDKKLKCNRQLPCDQCEKRSITATCEYIPYVTPRTEGRNRGIGSHCFPLLHSPGPRHAASGAATAAAGPAATARSSRLPSAAPLQARVHHLERLVQVLKAQQKDSKDDGQAEGKRNLWSDGLVDDLAGCTCPRMATTAGPIVDDLRYLNSANWEAIIDDLATLTNDLHTEDDEDCDDPTELATLNQSGPLLLLGAFPAASMPELIANLPPRPVTDRLIARFFQGKMPAWMMFHVPSFLRHYERFWDNPTKASYTFLGLIFLMISHAALFCLRADEEIPGRLGTAEHVFDIYRAHGAQCLVRDDYTRPGKMKVETMLLYFATEYLRAVDAVPGTSIVLTMAIRLAIHMGYHRDARHYPHLSPWEGEMKRRIWLILRELDVVVSFQFGVPSNMNTQFYDTEAPRNLNDEDFDEDTKELRPSRSETERTCTLYSIVRGRLVNIFSDILSVLSSRNPATYDGIMALDKQLEEVHDSFPPLLRYKPFSQSLTDPIDIIMQRYWLELLYQKARTVLHRKYIGISRLNRLYAPSRYACLDAATKTLRHQYDVHWELQPGGRLAKERWSMNSLSTHDFLLATMILCLEISLLKAQARDPNATEDVREALGSITTPAVVPKEQLMDILRGSRSIWQAQRKESAEANRAFKILSKMLNLSAGTAYPSSPESIKSGIDEEVDLRHPPHFQVGEQLSAAAILTQPKVQGVEVPTHQLGTQLDLHPSNSFEFPLAGMTSWAKSETNSSGHPEGQHFQGEWMHDIPGMPGPSTTPGSNDLIDPTLQTDWSLWDTQIQNANEDMLQIPWSCFFQPGSSSSGGL
ncbi:fungal-specific transcription factor domain-containing protein [Coniochaeta sp. 2T2.1]|nr:fungal-specific transcription factor domain-containing protein [Coniochaeta sp. 2T2.1]